MMRVLVAGLGSVGQRHVRNLRAVLDGDIEILAYRVRRLPRTLRDRMEVVEHQDVEATYGLRVFTDLDAALAEKPAAAFVCNPSSLHVPVALAAARAGCHLFIEKPLSDRLDGIDELIATVEERGLVGLVGYQLRFHPCLIRVKRLIDERAIGRVVSVHAEVGEYLPDAHPYEDYREGYAARRALGGGVMLSQIHEFDYLCWLFGRPRRVFAMGGRLSDLDLDVEDTAVTLMECEHEGRLLPVSLGQDFVRRPSARTCRIAGECGRIDLDLGANRLERKDRRGEVVERLSLPEFERNQLFVDELKHFLACVAGQETPRVRLEEGAMSVRVALSARAALATGDAVHLD